MLFIIGSLFLIILFASLIHFFSKIMKSDVVGATAHLDRLALEYAKKEEEVKKQYDEAKKQAQEILANAQNDAQQQKQSILKAIQEQKDKVLAEAQRKADELIQQADNARKALIAEIEQKIEERAAQVAVKLLKDSLPEHIRQDIHQRWFDDLTLSGFERLEHLHIPPDVNEATVISAFALNSKQRHALGEKLEQKLGRKINLKEELNPDIIAGLIMHIGSIVFDGSLRFKIQEAAVG